MTEKADVLFTNCRVVNVFTQRVEKFDIAIKNGVIVGLNGCEAAKKINLDGETVCPGLIDAHIHIESSMLTPARFAEAVVPHGTAAVVADPHEISNVYGLPGFKYMYEAAEGLPLSIFYTVPSCVPASPGEENGGALTPANVAALLKLPRVVGLGEVMDAEGLVAGRRDLKRKIAAAETAGKRIDGHAPGLSGVALDAYLRAGPDSDHECASIDEALEKLAKGCDVMLREGTAAKNLAALVMLLDEPYYRHTMLVSDDRHPEDLVGGHMDAVVRRALTLGADPIRAVTAATLNPARRYRLKGLGAVAPGYKADFITVDSLDTFNVTRVFRGGNKVAENGKLLVSARQVPCTLPPRMNTGPLTAASFASSADTRAIRLMPGQITTGVCDDENAVKAAVVERYNATGHIGVGKISGYGLSSGAVASTVAHDSHNMIVAGADDASMLKAAKALNECGGGLCVVSGEGVFVLPLEIGGLMTDRSAVETAARLEELKGIAHLTGVYTNADPFMTLSFLSLPVIPRLRLTTKGYVEVK